MIESVETSRSQCAKVCLFRYIILLLNSIIKLIISVLTLSGRHLFQLYCPYRRDDIFCIGSAPDVYIRPTKEV